MNILLIGQCSLHWGRMEFGNIGNYYIIEPFVRELHKVFPGSVIKTTMQMSERFCKTEKVKSLSLDLYYSWNEDLLLAKEELMIAQKYKDSNKLIKKTVYIEEVLNADLVIDFSGDIWGDNANFLGDNRFLVGLIKNRVAQLLKKKVVMLAGSPGPFSNTKILSFAKEVYAAFDLVTNREPMSLELMKRQGFDITKTKSLACPSFLFEPVSTPEIDKIIKEEDLLRKKNDNLTAGFILCGWNFEKGPYDKEIRNDSNFIKFAETVEYMTEKLGVRVCLMSHSNGFEIGDTTFQLKHGRDYIIMKQFVKVLLSRGIAKNFFTLNGIYDPWTTQNIIKNFDMIISGRIHGAVAGLSQSIPAVIIDYGHEPKAHKSIGFAKVVQVEEYVANPCSVVDLKQKIENCVTNIHKYKSHLKKKIPEVKNLARKNFELVKDLINE